MKEVTANTKLVRITHVAEKHRRVLKGRTGVVLALTAMGGAWVELNGEPIPDSASYFPGKHDHHNTIILYPFECEEVAL